MGPERRRGINQSRIRTVRRRNLICPDGTVKALDNYVIAAAWQSIDAILTRRKGYATGNDSSRERIFSKHMRAKNRLRHSADRICNQSSEKRSGSGARSVQRARSRDVVVRQS